MKNLSIIKITNQSSLRLIFFLFFSLSFIGSSISQSNLINVKDIGVLSYLQVKQRHSISPCEETYLKVLQYCVEDGSKVFYLFENGYLSGISFCQAHSTRYDAELYLSKLIREKKNSIGIEPVIHQGSTIFYLPSAPIFLAYKIEIFDNTYYSVFLTNKSPD